MLTILVVLVCLAGLLGLLALTIHRRNKDAQAFEEYFNRTYRGKRY